MKKKHFLPAFLCTLISGAMVAQSYVPELKNSRVLAKDVIAPKVYAIPIENVTLLDGPFKRAMEADAAYLLKIEPDRLLSDFRVHAGLQSKGQKYGGWESGGLAGHTLGHYMSACALQYASTGNKAFLDKVNYIVDELALCQPLRNGYLGAIPKEDSMWAEVKSGNIRSRGFDLNGAWSPWYTVHKIMAGLLDAYLYCNNNKALDIQKKFADWTGNIVNGLTDEQLQKMLACEYGGMNEVLVNTYAFTKDKKYYDLSYKFHDKRVLDSLALGYDVLPGKHSNTQIPKIIGSIRRYELGGDQKDMKRAEFFWNTVVDHHTYAPGGNSNYEYFGPADKLSETLSENTMETCNTYNMLKLTRHLFALNPNSHYFDFYENGLYNHILSSQNHDDGMMCYFVPLRMGGRKRFSSPFSTFTCCVGSGMENHVKYGEAIYATGADGSLYVNLYIASELNLKEKGIKLKQEVTLPEKDNTVLTISTNGSPSFTLRLRHPSWAKTPMVVKINGKEEQTVVDENGYVNLKRKWNNNDKIDISFPVTLYTKSMPDNINRQAIFYGPVVLAGLLGNVEPDPVAGIPVIVTTNNDPSSWLQKSGNENLRFASNKVGAPKDIGFGPFNQVKDEYYSVYFDVFTPESWKEQQAKYEAEKRRIQDIENRTVDVLRIGEMQPERDHEFTAENSTTGEGHGKKFRGTRSDGTMSFIMKVDPDKENSLLMSYWGMDNRTKVFDILVDGKIVATEDVGLMKSNRFYDMSYPIPADLTKGKGKVTILLKARLGNTIGPIYGDIRMVKK